MSVNLFGVSWRQAILLPLSNIEALAFAYIFRIVLVLVLVLLLFDGFEIILRREKRMAPLGFGIQRSGLPCGFSKALSWSKLSFLV